MQTDDNETEKADSTKDEKEKIPEVVNRNFGDRLASFFRINKSFNMEDEKIDDEKDTDESEQVPEVIPVHLIFVQFISFSSLDTQFYESRFFRLFIFEYFFQF